jgi:hypothetical protein
VTKHATVILGANSVHFVNPVRIVPGRTLPNYVQWILMIVSVVSVVSVVSDSTWAMYKMVSWVLQGAS